MKKTSFVCVAGSLMFLLSVPAFSQLDPTGEWAPQFHEDQPERGPGPEIGDYLGIPINDAARLRGGYLGRLPADAARAPVQAASFRLRRARSGQPARLEGSGYRDAET